MLEGMYTAAAGMAAQQSRLDAVSNDLANASTTGYKAVRMAYRDLAYTQGTQGATNVVRLGAGAAASMIGRDDRQGSIQETGNPRAPPITLPKGTQADDVHIGNDGTVTVAGKKAGQIRLVNVANPAGLNGGDSNRFQASAASGAVSAAPKTTVLHAGVLEASNVDMGQEMADMMDAERSFQLASKAIQVSDQALEIANGIKR